MMGIFITAAVYILSTVSVMGIIPIGDLQHSVTPFTDAAVKIWGAHARYWVSAGIAIAAFGALNGWILIQGQMPYAIAEDKLFPVFFSKLNKKNVPAAGIVLSSILVSVLMSMNYTRGLVEQFKILILLATLLVLVPYLFSTAAFIILKLENKKLNSNKNWLAAILLALCTFLFLIWAIIGSGRETVFWGFILLMAGLPFYVMVIWKKNN